MRKYLLILVALVLLSSCISAASAADTNDTQELTESTTISQEGNIAKDDIDSPTKIDKTYEQNQKQKVKLLVMIVVQQLFKVITTTVQYHSEETVQVL